MANPDCEACVTNYGSNYNGPPGPVREPFGGCTDCRSFACSHHGHRRSQGGFICIRCDPAALVGSAAQQVATSPRIDEFEEEADADAARQIRNVLVGHAAQNRPTEAWAYAEIADWYDVVPETRELHGRGVEFDDPELGISFYWSADPRRLDRAVARLDSRLNPQPGIIGARLEEITSRRRAGLRQVGLDPRDVNLGAGLHSLWSMAPRTARELMAVGLAIIPPTVSPRELPVTLDLLATAVGEVR